MSDVKKQNKKLSNLGELGYGIVGLIIIAGILWSIWNYWQILVVISACVLFVVGCFWVYPKISLKLICFLMLVFSFLTMTLVMFGLLTRNSTRTSSVYIENGSPIPVKIEDVNTTVPIKNENLDKLGGAVYGGKVWVRPD